MTLKVNVPVVVMVPSETVASKEYVLSAPTSPGDSKLGAAAKVTAPVEESILNNASSLTEDESTKA